ncbi:MULTISPECIES: MFS transporter [Pandoraea]|nr:MULTISPECIES: MFS transporter [Pandoraea]MBN9096339.1 MFS transporter [Pandoraea pnomenusa]PTD98399.1 MFS transporter [Pandoraea apista]RRJ27447.1 MFS transporter [Pandoraea apista]RRJ72858.1 MFS transporter [Pandoraea apista]RSC97905.1 MFS transporter [Pandoraea apista]
MTTEFQISRKASIPRTVWVLGLVSLFMDFSSELVHALLPIYLVTTMGMSVAAFGVLEGVAEATAMIVKVFSGAISDWLGRRKGLLLLGYGLSALTKPLFALATSPAIVVSARLLDRAGKGIRGAPRDALIADVAPTEIRGACFGLRQSMDTIGALLGPLLAILLMFWFSDQIRVVLWFAVAPAFVAIALIVFCVRESPAEGGTQGFRSPLHWRSLTEFSSRYWRVVAVGSAFALARFSEAFLVLRAQQSGLSIAWIPGVMVVMSLTYTVSAWPVGMLSDRMDRRTLLAIGMLLLISADLILGANRTISSMFVGVALWGLHMGFTQGTLATMVSESSPAALRGTAFGMFNLIGGLSMLLASAIAGAMWEYFGASVTFYAGAALVLVPLSLCWCLPRSTSRA